MHPVIFASACGFCLFRMTFSITWFALLIEADGSVVRTHLQITFLWKGDDCVHDFVHFPVFDIELQMVVRKYSIWWSSNRISSAEMLYMPGNFPKLCALPNNVCANMFVKVCNNMY